jgi:hypothetical protein
VEVEGDLPFGRRGSLGGAEELGIGFVLAIALSYVFRI